jgi:anaerobic dimethyl sulfoxide reductase subunit C (anchor subunit)/Tat-targeted selenate reductase subunit YnfH
MGTGFSDAALAVFTTLAPMGACAFVILAAAFATNSIDDEAAKRIDRMTLIPLLFILAGFIGATFHLASPVNAFNVVAGIGRSPLTNEVMVGGLFFLAALIYWIMAVRGTLTTNVRKVFLAALAVWSIVFALFCGFAYLMNTIPTWDTPWTVIQMLGYGLLGGALVGSLTLRAAAIDVEGKPAQVALAQAVIGLLCGLIGFAGQILAAGTLANIWGAAVSLVPAIWGLFALFAACGAVGVVGEFFCGRKKLGAGSLAALCGIVAVGIFFARIGFYGLFMSVAL